MMNFFTFASNDKSLEYLRQIFGPMFNVIPDPAGSVGAGNTITLLGSMFFTFNSAILAVAALMLVYITVVSVLVTAHEGEFMGKKWHKIWMPLRTVLGIAALVPTSIGYSGLQVLMMWVIVQGIGAADTLWSTALSYVDVMGSPFTQGAVPTVGTGQVFGDLFKAMVCDASARRTDANPVGIEGGGYYCAERTCPGAPSFSPNSSSYPLGPLAMCGTLTYCNRTTACTANPSDNSVGPDTLKCAACQGQIDALQTILPGLRAAAELFVQADYEYRSFPRSMFNGSASTSLEWITQYCRDNNTPIPLVCFMVTLPPANIVSEGGGDPQSPSAEAVQQVYWPNRIQPVVGSTNFISVAVGEYSTQISNRVNPWIESQIQDRTIQDQQLREAQSYGWIFAGSFYYTLANSNNRNMRDAIPELSMNLRSPSRTMMRGYRNNVAGATSLLTAMAGGGSFGGNAELSGMGELMGDTGASISSTSTELTTGGSNPLLRLTAAGSALLIVAEILFGVFLILTFTLGIVGNLSVFVLGTGAVNPVGGTLILVYLLLIPAFFGLLGILVSYGALLGIYVPLIPYIIFTVGAVGWIISTVETMVAGPLVALGILSPGGHHELLGKAEPALMLLFNVFLRPSLMIFGLIAALLVSSVAVEIVNATFGRVMLSVGTKSAILAWVFFLAAYISLVVTVLNKSFSAIHVIPERVMRWISGQADQYGEEQALGDTKQAVTGAASSAGGAMKGTRQEAAAGLKSTMPRVEKGRQDKSTGQAQLDEDKGDKK